MYECPNCGGDLRFDIPSQKLRCEHCDTTFDPYSVVYEEDAKETKDALQVTIFTCKSCGAEISSTNLNASGFCSYCGQPAVFSSRISNERKPEKIIPFKIDKAACRENFIKRMKGALYAPKELSDPDSLSGFVGIYMPYWLYDFSIGPQVIVPVSKSKEKGNYIYTDKFNMTIELSGKFEGMAFDASSSFDDHIADVIAPYDAREMMDFTPSFLCGFYADVPDVGSETYKDDAEVSVLKHTFKVIDAECKKKGFDRDSLGSNVSRAEDAVKLKYSGEKEAMLPVWFLTYRKGDRVCYSVMNGVTGKLAADIPVDFKKFYLTSLLIAIPVFILLNLSFTVQAKSTLVFSMIMAVVTAFIYKKEIDIIKAKEDPFSDQGYVAARCNGAFKDGKKVESNAYKEIGSTLSKKSSGMGGFSIIGFLVLAYWGIQMVLGVVYILVEFWPLILLGVIIVGIWMLWDTIKGNNKKKKAAEGKTKSIPERIQKDFRFTEISGVILGLIIAIVVLIWNPIDDINYYIASTIVFLGIVYTITGIIKKYNILSTHPIPEFFDREGANIHA
ncbi:hypothetical protein [Oribacterium sp. WCC10]|uniref:hypothetical protein n=1 Tax=Oribacterium sp. WCC10 TaxID=1855343 RepID=UPI0008E67624|nr:hypothetical protein [Oribacterium sp. WCC10]SFG53464.1 hypothetical protein SAMN05216356_11223 [Oribacterium sp. WCC10]